MVEDLEPVVEPCLDVAGGGAIELGVADDFAGVDVG
jgi:hypothetical protein